MKIKTRNFLFSKQAKKLPPEIEVDEKFAYVFGLCINLLISSKPFRLFYYSPKNRLPSGTIERDPRPMLLLGSPEPRHSWGTAGDRLVNKSAVMHLVH